MKGAGRVPLLAAALLGAVGPVRGGGRPVPPPDSPAGRFQDTVSSERIVVDVHVIDYSGNPIEGLSAADFGLKVDGRPVPIESLEWVPGTPAAKDRTPAAETAGEAGVPSLVTLPGRLIVLFFQTDYAESRITGEMRMIREAHTFLESCSADDRIAVVSFDSHLKLRQDFTGDRDKIRHAIDRSLYFDRVDAPPPGQFPSLAASFDFGAARRATLPEHALGVVGRALEALPGSKSLLFFGWGIGNYDSKMGLILDHNYLPARSALQRSHTSVFVLDITSADIHAFGEGLKYLAEDTGGLYVKTHLLPKFAMSKVTRAMSGWYVLTFARPDLRRGVHEMSIKVERHGHPWVLARPTYSD
ncbi:MAG TPA: VWA domain-containing protein [Thermoanaerobaculia bacterium]|nr:VWA domain-containing protein [Thermoanaerobaculia bacterium]